MRRMLFSAVIFVSVLSGEAQVLSKKEAPGASIASTAFVVATIKPSDPNATREGFPGDGRHLSCLNETVETIIGVAYGIRKEQIANMPEWLAKEHYDIDGVVDTGQDLTLDQEQEVWRRLLADRFHLVVHKEMRQLPVYALSIAKGGSRLQVATPDETTNTGNNASHGQRTLKFRNMSMAGFMLNMNWYVDRPIIDRTGLGGHYDFTLKWTYDFSQPHGEDAPPLLFTAMKEQLGLQLDPIKGSAEVLVVDHVERPSAN